MRNNIEHNNNSNNSNNNNNNNNNKNNNNNFQSSAMISGAILFLSTFLKLNIDALHFCEQFYRPAFNVFFLNVHKFEHL